ncbi:MAG: hypothetical protein HY319_22825 [Armatimonadetes bacterium]|nr:hypothetical protein [Armatimonadota bacterium]
MPLSVAPGVSARQEQSCPGQRGHGPMLLTVISIVVINRTCRHLPSPFEMGVVLVILVVLAAILVPNFIRARARGQLTACKSNLKNIGIALDMYSTDNGGYYPWRLTELTPEYLKTIPTCPRAGSDTYGDTYRRSRLNLYTVCCGGGNHEGAGIVGDYPLYSSAQGLVERP